MPLRELMRTSDAVLLSFVEATLKATGIAYVVADRHISAIEGSIGIFPRRVLVEAAILRAATLVLIDAGLEGELANKNDATSKQMAAQVLRWGWPWPKS